MRFTKIVAGSVASLCLVASGGLAACSKDEDTSKAAADDETTTTAFSGDPDGEFCENLRSLFSYPGDMTPEQLKIAVDGMTASLDVVTANPPSEIADSVETFNATARTLVRAFEVAEYQFDKVDYTTVEGMESEEYNEAVSQLFTYHDQVCTRAVAPTETTAVPGAEGSTGTEAPAGEVPADDAPADEAPAGDEPRDDAPAGDDSATND